MRLALLSPIHGQSIDHIARQLENYRTFLAPFELRHYLHISLDSSPLLGDHLRAFAEREQHSILLTQRSRPTWRPCTAHALSELIKTVLADGPISDAAHHFNTNSLITPINTATTLSSHNTVAAPGVTARPMRSKN